MGWGSSNVTAVAQAAAVACVPSLAWELTHAVGMAEKERKKKLRKILHLKYVVTYKSTDIFYVFYTSKPIRFDRSLYQILPHWFNWSISAKSL